MKIKCSIDGEIYEVIEEDEFCFQVRGIYLGFPVWISKKDCEVLNEDSKHI